MNFHDVTFCITIGAATINAAITASKIVKIREEEPLYKIYKEILCQRFLLWILIIPIVLEKVNIFLWR